MLVPTRLRRNQVKQKLRQQKVHGALSLMTRHQKPSMERMPTSSVLGNLPRQQIKILEIIANQKKEVVKLRPCYQTQAQQYLVFFQSSVLPLQA